jgi:hypothetical protein
MKTADQIFFGVMMLALLGMMISVPFVLRGICRWFRS